MSSASAGRDSGGGRHPGRDLLGDLKAVGPSWLVARVLLVVAYVVAVAVANRLTPGSRPGPLGEGLIAWDGTWYRDIAEHGYAALPREGLRFFPLFALAGRALAVPFGRADVALVVVANVASLAVGVFVYRLVRFERSSAAVAERAVWLMMLFPSAFVFAWAYAEAVMLASAVGAFLAIRTRRWWWAALACVVAATSRPLGVLLAVPVLVEVVRGWRSATPWDRTGRVAAVVAPVFGAGAFLLWVRIAHGDALLPFTVQNGLRGEGVNPIARLWEGLGQMVGAERFGDGLHIPFAFAFVVLLVITFRRWPVSYGLYAGAVLVAALSAENLNSLERYGLNAFPIVLTLALLVREPRVERATLAVLGGGFVALASLAWLGAYVP